jgi:diadenosine tetraphosphate (Ap4A) HIT family hydrolase
MVDTCSLCDRVARLHDVPADDIVWQRPSSIAFLGPWQFYHGYCVLVARQHVREPHHQPDADRRALFDDLCTLAEAIESAFRPRKLNFESLGNQVPHLHWHLFPRYESDPRHLQAVWLDIARAESDEVERQRLVTGPMSRAETTAVIRRHLDLQTGAR